MKSHDNLADLYFVRLSIIIGILLKIAVFFTAAATVIGVISAFSDKSDPDLLAVLIIIVKGVIAIISEIISVYLIQVFCELVMYLHNISESLEEMNLKGNSSNQSHNISTDDDSFEALVNSYEENQ